MENVLYILAFVFIGFCLIMANYVTVIDTKRQRSKHESDNLDASKSSDVRPASNIRSANAKHGTGHGCSGCAVCSVSGAS